MESAMQLRGGVPISDRLMDYTNPILLPVDVTERLCDETSRALAKHFTAEIGTHIDKVTLVPHPLEHTLLSSCGSISITLKGVHR